MRRLLALLLIAAGILAAAGSAWIYASAQGRTFRTVGETWRLVDAGSHRAAAAFLADTWPEGLAALGQPSSWLLIAVPLAFLLPGLLLAAIAGGPRRRRRVAAPVAVPPPRPKRVRRDVAEGIAAIQAGLAHSDAAAAAEARILLVDRGFGWSDAEAAEAEDRLVGMVLAAPRFPQALAMLVEQRYRGRGGPAMEELAARLEAARYVDRLLSSEPPRGTAAVIATIKRHREAARSLALPDMPPAPRADVRDLLAAVKAPSVVAAKFDGDMLASGLGRGGRPRGLAHRIRAVAFTTVFLGVVAVGALGAWAEIDPAELGERVLGVMLAGRQPGVVPAAKLAAAKERVSAEPDTWVVFRYEGDTLLVACNVCSNAAVSGVTLSLAGTEQQISGNQALAVPQGTSEIIARLDFLDGTTTEPVPIPTP